MTVVLAVACILYAMNFWVVGMAFADPRRRHRTGLVLAIAAGMIWPITVWVWGMEAIIRAWDDDRVRR